MQPWAHSSNCKGLDWLEWSEGDAIPKHITPETPPWRVTQSLLHHALACVNGVLLKACGGPAEVTGPPRDERVRRVSPDSSCVLAGYLQSPVAGLTDVTRNVGMLLLASELAPAGAPAPPGALVPARPETVPVTSTFFPTCCCRFSPPLNR
jgi:hypothetical protein